MEVCKNCLDVVAYCTCRYENQASSQVNLEKQPAEVTYYRNGEKVENPSFHIYRGEQCVLWDGVTKNLSGDKELRDSILNHLNNNFVETDGPYYYLWLTPQDPHAVYWVAKRLVSGCTFSSSAPNW